MTDNDELVGLWFGDWNDGVSLPDGDPQLRLWWSKDDAVDAMLRARFADAHLAAARGALDADAAHPVPAIARILLLDQIPRNIYRGTAHMFATDALATRATRALRDGALWQALPPIHRYFALLPLMHSEDAEDQHACVDAYAELAGQTAHLARAGVYRGAIGYAERHRDIVLRFGRFPHRNEALGRDTTPDEAAFLREPGSSF